MNAEPIAATLECRTVTIYETSIVVAEAAFPVPSTLRHGASLERLLALLPLGDSSATLQTRAVFLDIETTGLNSGAGTLVFLVGLAYVADHALFVRQYFLHDPAVERQLLSAVATCLADFDVVITFNGKTFDAPLLGGRYDLHRLPDPFPVGHVDLLHLARRIWGRRLRQRSLGALEVAVLGIARQQDVIGREVPSRYFDFLRDGRVDLIGPVLEHNRLDLRSMVALAQRIDVLLGERDGSEADRGDLLGVGRVLEGAGRVDDARRCYEDSLVGATAADRAEALFRLAMLVDRGRELSRAIDLLSTVADYSVARAIPAAIELAKIFEHRLRQPDRALGFARRARELGRIYPDTAGGAPLDLDRRIRRLERKIGGGERI